MDESRGAAGATGSAPGGGDDEVTAKGAAVWDGRGAGEGVSDGERRRSLSERPSMLRVRRRGWSGGEEAPDVLMLRDGSKSDAGGKAVREGAFDGRRAKGVPARKEERVSQELDGTELAQRDALDGLGDPEATTKSCRSARRAKSVSS